MTVNTNQYPAGREGWNDLEVAESVFAIDTTDRAYNLGRAEERDIRVGKKQERESECSGWEVGYDMPGYCSNKCTMGEKISEGRLDSRNDQVLRGRVGD